MPDNQFINLEELSKTAQALLSKINEQSNLKVNKNNVKSELSEGTKIGSIEGVNFYAPEIDTSNFMTWDADLGLATVAYSGSYNDLNNTPSLATVATSGSYNDLKDKPSNTIPSLPILKIEKSGIGLRTTSDNNFWPMPQDSVSNNQFFLYLIEGSSYSFSSSQITIRNTNNTGNECILYLYSQNGESISTGTLNHGELYLVTEYNMTRYSGTGQGKLYLNTQAKNALTVSGHTVATNVPANAVFTDTVYDDTAISSRITTLENAGYQNSTQVNSAIATAIGNINQFEVSIVTDLPTTNIDTHTIYFKSNSSSGNNVYDEYMYINNNWELIGSTQIDLTPYALKTEIPNAETDANVETMLDSFNLDYTSNSSSPNVWQGGSY